MHPKDAPQRCIMSAGCHPGSTCVQTWPKPLKIALYIGLYSRIGANMVKYGDSGVTCLGVTCAHKDAFNDHHVCTPKSQISPLDPTLCQVG